MIEKFDPLKGEMWRVLDDAGGVREGLDPGLGDADLRRIYGLMATTRAARDTVSTPNEPSTRSAQPTLASAL